MLLLRRSLLSPKSISFSLTSNSLSKVSPINKHLHTTTINMSDMKKIFTSNSMARKLNR
jgi:hypothetical protein